MGLATRPATQQVELSSIEQTSSHLFWSTHGRNEPGFQPGFLVWSIGFLL